MNALPVIVIRPEPGNAATVAAARAAGLEAAGYPLFSAEPVTWGSPGPAGFDGLLAGSANVFRLGGSQLDGLTDLPVHVVGGATADAARRAGFSVATTGSGGLQKVLDGLPGQHLLRLAGEDRIELVPPAGTAVETRVVYTVRPLAISGPLHGCLATQCVVMLHSGEAARHFSAECARLGIGRENIALACLAPRVAAIAGSGWAAVETAPASTDPALLALAGQMCQNDRPGGNGQPDQSCRTTS